MVSGIPDGWGARMHDQADLDASYSEVASLEGYTGESLRGRIRCLQMHLGQADQHFRRARALVAKGADVCRVQVALTSAYEREHALLAQQERSDRPQLYLDACDETLRAIASFHRGLDGLEAVYDGRPEEARAVYVELLDRLPEAGPERKALWNLGLGVCEVQMLHRPEARRRLEVAGLHICDPGCRTLGRAQISARLAHVHSYLRDGDAAREWWQFLASVRCPEPTRQAMRRRSELLSEQSLRLGRCVLC